MLNINIIIYAPKYKYYVREILSNLKYKYHITFTFFIFCLTKEIEDQDIQDRKVKKTHHLISFWCLNVSFLV